MNNIDQVNQVDQVDQIDLDAFHWHEASDRIAFIAEMFDSVTCNHPVFLENQELLDLSDKVAVELARLYNKISELDPFNPL